MSARPPRPRAPGPGADAAADRPDPAVTRPDTAAGRRDAGTRRRYATAARDASPAAGVDPGGRTVRTVADRPGESAPETGGPTDAGAHGGPAHAGTANGGPAHTGTVNGEPGHTDTTSRGRTDTPNGGPGHTGAPDDDGGGLLARRYRSATIGVLLVVMLLAFEAMAIGTAMPAAARDLHGIRLYAWGFSAVFIAGLVANVVAGGWADARGPARPLLAGLAVFVAGLVIAGTAPGMTWFVAGRAVQGFGSGLAVVPVYVIVARVYPERARPRMFSAMSSAWVLPALVGPSVGGLIAQHAGWRWVFLGLVPLVVPAVLMLAPALRGTGTRGPMPRGRALAAVALATGAGLLQWGADHRSPVALAGLAALAYGLRALMPRGTLLLRRGLPAAVAMRGLLMGAMIGTEAFIPLALTTRHGFSPAEAGTVLTAGALGWSAGSWCQGRYTGERRVRFAVGGAALLAAAVAGLIVALATSGWAALPVWILAGAGMGLAFPALSLTVLGLSEPTEQGANSSALQISDTLGSSLAIGAAGALVNAAGLGAGFAWTLAIAVVAAATAHRVEHDHA